MTPSEDNNTVRTCAYHNAPDEARPLAGGAPHSNPQSDGGYCIVNSAKRKELKRALRAIADGTEGRMPLMTVLDRYTCGLMRDAALAIEHLEARRKKRK